MPSERDRIDQFSGIEKAAVVLLALGETYGGPIWSQLDDDEIRLLSQTIAGLGNVPGGIIDSVLIEFAQKSSAPAMLGDTMRVQSLIRGVLSDERLEHVAAELGAPKGRTIWQKIQNMPVDVLINHLKLEHPQSIAVILMKLKNAHAARILAELDDDLALEVMNRILVMESVSREVLEIVESSLKDSFISSLSQGSRRDAHKYIADLLNSLDTDSGERLMYLLRVSNEFTSEKIRRAMFTFDDLINIDAMSAQVIVRSIDKTELAKALKGSSQGLKDFFLNQMTGRGAARFREDMQALGPLRLKDVDEARQNILRVVKKLEETGEIILSRGGEDDLILV
ncbi:flagellar motor switch protein FliG [uncultured Alsobacter sp.]|uniref:flagellar motor switch protein FliG n=1 Tax=uncultured Alsobacter sp. TaxID=1748258 RepID=UPI0025DD4139|nr:flagellar motor switch protein FliG [uncultured Alsobacter sp.]